ncbi:MAG: hypothetical protein DPW16_20805 [Chloroflexi bacterium]|nr:hypothetical protein [Chloroflexota bacterium]
MAKIMPTPKSHTAVFKLGLILLILLTACNNAKENSSRPHVTPVLTPGEIYYRTTCCGHSRYKDLAFGTTGASQWEEYVDDTGMTQKRFLVQILVWSENFEERFEENVFVFEGQLLEYPSYRIRILETREDNPYFLGLAILDSSQ